jgi:hypothetical protein
MDSQPARNHREFLAGLRERIASLESEIAELRIVERFHEREFTRLGGQPSAIVNGSTWEHTGITVPELGTDISPAALAAAVQGKPKYEAAQIVLKGIGKPVRIPDIVRALTAANYGTELKRTIFVNSLYTAMTRREDVFVKKGPGEWALKEWENAG